MSRIFGLRKIAIFMAVSINYARLLRLYHHKRLTRIQQKNKHQYNNSNRPNRLKATLFKSPARDQNKERPNQKHTDQPRPNG